MHVLRRDRLVQGLGWSLLALLGLALPGFASGTNFTTGIRTSVGLDADPINLATAEYTFLERLAGLGGPLPLEFRLFYGSALNTRRLPDGLPFKFAHDRHAFLVHDTAANTLALEMGPAIETGFVKVNGEWILGGGERSRLQLLESGDFYYLCDPIEERVHIYRRFQTNRTEVAAALEIVMDRRGNRLLYDQTRPGQRGPDAVRDETGRELRFDYRFPGRKDTNAYLASITDQGGREWRFVYEEDAPDVPGTLALRALVLPDGRTNRFHYATNGNQFLHAIQLPRGNVPSRQTYRTNTAEDRFNGKVVRQVDALGHAWEVRIDFFEPFEHPISRLSLEQPDGTARSYVHDHGGTILRRFTDEDANSIDYQVDPVRDRFNQIVDRRGETNRIEYHEPSGKIASWTNGRGQRQRFHYTERRVLLDNPMKPEAFPCTFFDLTRVDHPDGTFEELEYDAKGNVVAHRDAAGAVTRFAHDARGQVVARTNALGGVTRYDYDAHANLVAEDDSDGVSRGFGYDAWFRRTSVTNADGSVVRYAFDALDRPTSVTDELGVRLEMAYDANGNLARLTRAAGTPLEQVETFEYDAMDRLVRQVDAAGAATTYAHTFRGGLKRATFVDGVAVELDYDRRHFVTEILDEAGHRLQAARDGEGLPTHATSPTGREVAAAYDPEGFPVEVRDPRGNRFVLAWDARQRLTNVVDRLGRGLVIERDGEGRILKLQLPVVGAARYGRNALGLITNLVDFRGESWRLDYTPMGRLRGVRDPVGHAWRFDYDNRGRLARMVHPDGIAETLVYDAASRLVRREFSDGMTLGFTRDALGRVRATASAPVALEYDARDLVTTRTEHGARFRATYDDRRRLATLDYDGLTTLTYAYDPRGLVRRVGDARSGAFVELEHDADRLLVRIRRSNGVTTDFERDANGQVTRIRHGGRADLHYTRNGGDEIVRFVSDGLLDVAAFLPRESETFQYDPANQLTAAGFAHDPRGRRLRDPRRTYGWDAADRLVAVTNGATVLVQEFTASGEVAREMVNGVATEFFHHDAVAGLPVLAERREGTYRRYYAFTPDGMLLFAVDAPARAPSFPHFDHAGTTVLLTDRDGAVTDTYGYSPYGRLMRHEGPSDQPYTYNGQFGVRRVGDTGIHHMGARFYDALTGRFLSRDPAWRSLLERPTELNPYGFARQNPVTFADPTGRESMVIRENGTRIRDPEHDVRPGEVVGEVDDDGRVRWKVAVEQEQGGDGRKRFRFVDHEGEGPFKCVHLSPSPMGRRKSRKPDSLQTSVARAPGGADLQMESIIGSTLSRRMQATEPFRPPRITKEIWVMSKEEAERYNAMAELRSKSCLPTNCSLEGRGPRGSWSPSPRLWAMAGLALAWLVVRSVRRSRPEGERSTPRDG